MSGSSSHRSAPFQADLSSVVVAAALTAAAGVAAEPVDSAATVAALEKRVAALEQKKEVEPIVLVAPVSRRAQARAAWTSAAGVERYLQYPGQ